MGRKDEEINELLREYEYNSEKFNNIQKTLGLLKNYLKSMGRFPEKAKQSEMDKKLLMVKELTWINEIKRVPGNQELLKEHMAEAEIEVDVEIREEDYEQLSLPGCEAERGEIRKVKKKISISSLTENKCYRKAAAKRGIGEILEDHSKQCLLDYNKYLGTDVAAKSSKETLAKGIEEWITRYPLQLLLTFSRSTIKLLRKLTDMKEESNISVTEKNVDDFMQLMTWGLLDVAITYQNEEIFFEVSVPADVKECILPQFENITREKMEESDVWCYFASGKGGIPDEKKVWDSIGKIGDDIHFLLLEYGILDVETFHRLFTEIYQTEFTKKQLMRFVYLWGTFHQRLLTGKLVAGKEIYVGNPELAIDAVFLKREKYCKDIPYRCQSKEEMLAEMDLLMRLWAVVGASFYEWELDEEELERIMMDGHQLIQEGMAVSDLMEYFFSCFEMEEQLDLVMLWRFLTRLGLGTPLPMLKGYSRIGFQQKYGKYQYLDLFRGTDKRIRKAALYELPVEMQEKLADLVILAETADYETLKAEETKLPFSCMHNEQVKIFLVINRLTAYGNIQDEEKKSAVEQNLRKMVLDLCGECRDEYTSSKLLELASKYDIVQSAEEREPVYVNERDADYFWDDEWEEPVAPVVKAEKVYPNDPCPCGSGKKFKKCCKGKGIYD